MFQVYAFCQSNEIGFGKSLDFDVALEECIESMKEIYPLFAECEEIVIRYYEDTKVGKLCKQTTLASLFQNI
jgi:hypothetical protein